MKYLGFWTRFRENQTVNLVIRYHGAWVTRVELPESGSEIRLGRAPENDVILSFDFVSREHARVFQSDGSWFYEDLRTDHPRYDPNPIRLTSSIIISIEGGLELLAEETFQGAETRIQDRRFLTKFQMRRRGDKRRFALGMALSLLLIGAGYLLYQGLFKKVSHDANEIFGMVRPTVVEFVKVKEEKAIRDYKKYAEMKDEDFVEEMGFCTGFKIAPTIVMTANHCMHGTSLVDGSIDFRLRTFDGKVHEATRILGFDIKKDFLILEAPSLQEYGFLKISNDPFRVGEPVYTVGNVSGEGLAIREGITASKTKDQNDPSIEFVRFSAAASGGNSGGPLVNAQGEVLALVFAATWDGNYNMGAGADYLREAKEKFVDHTEEKTVLVEPRKLLNFQPLMIPYQLYFPTLDSAYESPDHFRLLEQMNFELKLPASLEDHYRALIDGLNRAASEKMQEVESRLRQEGFRSKDWADQVSDEVPMLVFGETSSIFARVPLPSKKNDFLILPQVLSTALPMGPTAYKAFLQTLRNENYFSYIPELQQLALRVDATQIPDETDVSIYRAGNYTQRETLERITYEPFGVAISALEKPEEGWSETRKIDANRILKVLVADGLIGTSANSFYLRPNARRDFLIKSFDEEVVKFETTDLGGRKWQAFSFRLFDGLTLDTYCLPLPQGVYCQSINFQATRPELLKVLRENFMKSQLTNRVLPGFFSQVDAILDFQTKGSESLPPWNDYEVRREANGKLHINFKTFGLQFDLPSDGSLESIRLNAAVLKSKPGIRWAASGFEFIQKTKEPGIGRRYCEVSFERKNSRTSSVLAALRAEEQSRERPNRKRVTLDDPNPIWQHEVVSVKTNTPLTLYAYCVPAQRYGDANQLVNFDFDDRESYQPGFKLVGGTGQKLSPNGIAK